MKYVAKFGIDGGVSHGFGLKESDYSEKEEIFELEIADDERAFAKAGILAYKLSKDSLSNPKNRRN
ncbi:MAG: hypothetical protein Q8O84_00020 [Nanoarchaeota archaeon]|nr:hypothetical protein [Nanoarchaeota archaeon]